MAIRNSIVLIILEVGFNACAIAPRFGPLPQTLSALNRFLFSIESRSLRISDNEAAYRHNILRHSHTERKLALVSAINVTVLITQDLFSIELATSISVLSDCSYSRCSMVQSVFLCPGRHVCW